MVVNLPLPNGTPMPTAMNTQLRYHLGFANADGAPARVQAGKRIRPLLVLMSAVACDGDPAQALPAAAAVELLHNFSLIHDDIEDGDALRRGRPTLWKIHGVPQGINSGDAMFAQAHQAMQRLAEAGVPAQRVLHALRVFDGMCVHLTAGQHLDIGFEQRSDVTADEYLAMISGKTGALVMACCEIGGIVAGASALQLAALHDFGFGVGRAFQLQDDVLGIWGDTAKTGKAQGDLARRKKTLPVLHACDQDAGLRAGYFGEGLIDEQSVANRIEALGGRSHTETMAAGVYASALAALDNNEFSMQGSALLRALAQSLIGRVN